MECLAVPVAEEKFEGKVPVVETKSARDGPQFDTPVKRPPKMSQYKWAQMGKAFWNTSAHCEDVLEDSPAKQPMVTLKRFQAQVLQRAGVEKKRMSIGR